MRDAADTISRTGHFVAISKMMAGKVMLLSWPLGHAEPLRYHKPALSD